MSQSSEYDLMTIGGGSAAFAAAIKAAELCYRSAYPQFEGLTACPPPSDWRRVVQQKDELVAALREGKYIRVAETYPSITIMKGEARLLGGGRVSVNGNRYEPDKIVIATGSHPWAPPIPGLQEAGFLDSEQALSLEALPASMIVMGGGSIGLEFAQLFARFGVKVMVLESGPHVARTEEPEIGEALIRYLEDEKVRTCTNVAISRVERQDGAYLVHTETYGKPEICRAKEVLVATGRRPNTNGFGLEQAGVRLGPKGEIIVNEHLQTTNPNIYAAGDCIGDPMYVYVAAYAGGLAAENALSGMGRLYDLTTLPHVTFTDPQIASVGLTEKQARAKGLHIQTAILPLAHVPRALAARNTKGLIKLVAEADTGRLLGAHILATEAGEVIQEATLALRFGLTVQDLADTFHPYLTMVEGLKLAALTFKKDVSKLSCCAT